MTTTTILGLITLGVVFLALLMAVYALVVPTRNKLANRLMGVYLLVLATTISVFFYHQHLTLPLVLEKLRDDIGLLAGPLFYLFVLSLLYQDFRLRWRHLWHLWPFLLSILLFFPNFYGVSEVARKAFFKDYFSHWEAYAMGILAPVQAVCYLVLVFLALRRYRKVLRENYANTAAETHKWLWQMNVLLTILFCFSFFKSVFKRLVDDYELVMLVRIGMAGLLLCFLCWLLFKILLQPNLFRGVESGLVPLRNAEGAVAGAKEVEKQETEKRIIALRKHMTEQEPYLVPDLTVKSLAQQLNWPERELSLLINQYLNRHFFDFINDYRIVAAQRILRDPVRQKMTVLEILYAVGFNSKSSFNVAFKNRTGVTPTAFRKGAGAVYLLSDT